MQESIINLTEDKIMNKVGYGLRGKIWFGAFEDGNDAVCVANFDMPAVKLDWIGKCEKIYRATQNIMDSWSLTLEQINDDPRCDRKLDKKQDGADWISPKNFYRNYGHRSMSVGDVIQFGRDHDKKVYYACASFGFTELTSREYDRWLGTDSRDRDMFVSDIVKAKATVELIAKEEALVN